LPTLAAAALLPLFIAAGQWQWNKATLKADLQTQLETRGAEPPVQVPLTRADADALRYRQLVAHGHYDVEHQILIDNRMHRGRAGFHVITPLRVDGSEIRLLVNRGWIPAASEHSQVPQVPTPISPVDVAGRAMVPGTRFFTLGGKEGNGNGTWNRVWQNLDLNRFEREAGFPVQPVLLELGPDSAAGGFVREWVRPDARRLTNLGYAWQWWSFALLTVVLWVVFTFRREPE
jgi:surfeit locus 1 family protein